MKMIRSKLQDIFSPYRSKRIVVISDSRVGPLYGESLQKELLSLSYECELFLFPEGDENKTRAVKEQLENRLFEKGIGKDSVIVGLGGGVVTDMAAFVAATFCRGLPLILIPTTLLSMVDAAHGGKNGVNTPYGKNLIGTHYEAQEILMDATFLKTLPLEELKNGLAETIKHALLSGGELFSFLEKKVLSLLACDEEAMGELITLSVAVKKKIVVCDPLEKGMRRLLNLGHTVAHALELFFDYKLSHGRAVAFGLWAESFMAYQLGYMEEKTFLHIKKILTDFCLITTPLPPFEGEVREKIFTLMGPDKKSRRGQARFAFISEMGRPLSFEGEYCLEIPYEIILLGLREIGL